MVKMELPTLTRMFLNNSIPRSNTKVNVNLVTDNVNQPKKGCSQKYAQPMEKLTFKSMKQVVIMPLFFTRGLVNLKTLKYVVLTMLLIITKKKLKNLRSKLNIKVNARK